MGKGGTNPTRGNREKTSKPKNLFSKAVPLRGNDYSPRTMQRREAQNPKLPAGMPFASPAASQAADPKKKRIRETGNSSSSGTTNVLG